ncbi:MAG: hypothetical protein ABI042_01335 [Verrucomicrobiota bacterium]
MRYDFTLIQDLCKELGLLSRVRSNQFLEVQFDQGAMLCFQNAERDKDCLVGFDGTPWHTHDDFIFDDGKGNFIEMNYFDVLTGLNDGHVLICERWQQGKLTDRWLVHCEYNDEFNYLGKGDEIRVRRPRVPNFK